MYGLWHDVHLDFEEYHLQMALESCDIDQFFMEYEM